MLERKKESLITRPHRKQISIYFLWYCDLQSGYGTSAILEDHGHGYVHELSIGKISKCTATVAYTINDVTMFSQVIITI